MYCSLFLLINTLFPYFFVGIHFCRAEGPGPCHWPLVWWLGFGASHCTTQPQSLSGNWKLCFRPLQLRPLEIILSGGLYINTHKKSPGSMCTNNHVTPEIGEGFYNVSCVFKRRRYFQELLLNLKNERFIYKKTLPTGIAPVCLGFICLGCASMPFRGRLSS